MNQCCLVWEISTIEGEHYNPITYAIYVRKAKKFSEKLNQYFQSKKMDWKCILDRSACTYDEIFREIIRRLFLYRKRKRDNGCIKKMCKRPTHQHIIWILRNTMRTSGKNS